MDEKPFDFSDQNKNEEAKSEENASNQNDVNVEPQPAEVEQTQSEQIAKDNSDEIKTDEQSQAISNETEAKPVVDDSIEEVKTEIASSEKQEIETTDTKPEEIKSEQTTEEVKPEETTTEEVKAEKTVDKVVETKDNEPKKEKEVKRVRSSKQKHYDEVFNELKEKMNTNEIIEVEIISRIRGGLRVHYKNVALFLPTSHYTLKRNPSEEIMNESIGKKIEVKVHEYQEFDEDRKAVIVSRKKILLNEIWEQIKVGDIIEGKISSIATFGVFVEFSGIEGLIHISRLSRAHIDNPSKHFKKGEPIKAKIIEIHKDKNKIALSRKELEESPWTGIAKEFNAGDQVTGIVRRLTDFGAYVELKPGVDGLLRNKEIHWTKRVKRPSDILKPGQEIKVEIMTLSEEKHNAALSLKRTQPNPWAELAEKFKIGTEFEGEILQVIPQGAIVNIDNDIDGFMPRSKMRSVMHGKKIPYKTGDKVEVIVTDINPSEESLILSPKADENEKSSSQAHNKRNQFDKKKPATNNSSFSLGDMLSENQKEQLKNLGQ